MTARRRNLLMMVVMLLGASSASAIDPAIKCQSDKLRLAAKYTACRLEAEAAAARTFAQPDFRKCKNAYLSGWQKAETRARSRGTYCWTRDDAELIEGDIDAHTAALAEWLGGKKR